MKKSGDTCYIRADGNRQKSKLGKELGQGANGKVFLDATEPTRALKIYQGRKLRRDYAPKVLAMLAIRPRLKPIKLGNRQFVQLAWPLAIIEGENASFAGFAMPVVDFKESRSLEDMLQAKVRRKLNLPENLRHRVALAANLASIMTELHAVGHYMIDMKPTNIRVYPDTMYLAVLDCDGFSIRLENGQRIPAAQFSSDYIAPEAKNEDPENLGEAQDLFALAIIIFRLLNNGLHPFQGRMPTGHPDPGVLQDRINAKLYAYGLKKYSIQSPAPQSIHEYFDDDTRQLFDRAFATTSRPTAEEWRRHLNALRGDTRLKQCSIKPYEHEHFSKGCPFCKTSPPRPASIIQQTAISTKHSSNTQSNASSHPSIVTTTSSNSSIGQNTSNPRALTRKDKDKYLPAIAIGMLLFFTIIAVSNAPKENLPKSSTTQAAIPPPTTYAPPPSPTSPPPAPQTQSGQIQGLSKSDPALNTTQPTNAPSPSSQPNPPIQPTVLPPPRQLPLSTIAGPVEDVLDTANIMVGGRIVQLDGIRGLRGKHVKLMEEYIKKQGSSVICNHSFGDKYLCRLPNGVDLGRAAVFNGAAWVLPGGPAEYDKAEANARERKKGVWGNGQ